MPISARRCCWLLVIAVSLAGCAVWPSPENDSPPDSQVAAPAVVVSEDTPSALEEKVIAANREEDNIYFPLGGVTVSTREKAKLQQHAAYLKANSEKSVTLIGYTDDLGSRSYNVAIAEQRVAAVREVLRSYRVPPGQIHRYSVGSEKTPSACKTPRCRQKMRRVELVYSPG